MYLWPMTRMDGVMLGVAVAMLFEAGYRLERPAIPTAAALVLAGLLLFAPPWSRAPQFSLFAAMPVASCCTALVVWALASGAAVPAMRRVLSSLPLTYLGDRSYSIYLWHYFVGVALLAGGEGFAGPRRFVLQIVASLVVAIAVYATIEQPGRIYLNRLIAAGRLAQARGGARPEQSMS
jgi:peptidoglycan/LPS O-acetylase OafA/YrhL